jgi:molecular chaperone DnaK (HSP70)
VEAVNRLEQVVYQLENMKKDNEAKIPEDEKAKIDALIAEAKALKDKEGYQGRNRHRDRKIYQGIPRLDGQIRSRK